MDKSECWSIWTSKKALCKGCHERENGEKQQDKNEDMNSFQWEPNPAPTQEPRT